jgi:hypothetical protein
VQQLETERECGWGVSFVLGKYLLFILDQGHTVSSVVFIESVLFFTSSKRQEDSSLQYKID